MKKSKKVLALALAAMMAVSAFAGCGDKTEGSDTTTTTKAQGGSNDTTTKPNETTTKAAPYKLSITVPYGDHAHDELDLRIELLKRMEEYTNTDITWELYASDAYYEKLTLRYASGEFATIMVTDNKTADFKSAAAYDTFWELSNYFDLYDNLSIIPDSVRMNASENGKVYGVPRSRNLGRNACAYRQDWADNLGLGHPETIDDLYQMAVAFTNDDPDGNGKNDTYGFGLDSWPGQWTIMLPWFGVHNTWGFDDNGNLEYYVTQPEYKTALKAFRQWNAEGLINEGWEALGPGAAEKSIFRENIAGISIQVADCPRKSQEAMNGSEETPGKYPEARFTYFGAVEGGYGYNVLPTEGYQQMVSVTKALAPTEDDLKKCLQFLNDINDAEMRNLIEWGLEGKDYFFTEDGWGQRYTADEKSALGISTASYRDGYNQLLGYWTNAEEAAKLIKGDPSLQSEIKNAEEAIKIENEQYTIANYGAGLSSQTYIDKGENLDKMIADAQHQYIVGEIDETALDNIIQQWREAGGDAYIAEINASYQATKK